MKLNRMWIAILLVCCTSFEYGCTSGQRREIAKDALDGAKQWFTETAVPELKAYAAKVVDEKLAEKERKHLDALDQQLAKFPKIDEEGNVTPRTWRDFDADGSGHLEEGEILKAGQFVATEATKKVVAGEMSSGEAVQTTKTAGVTLAGLLMVMLATRGVKKLKNGKKPDPPGIPAPPAGGPA